MFKFCAQYPNLAHPSPLARRSTGPEPRPKLLGSQQQQPYQLMLPTWSTQIKESLICLPTTVTPTLSRSRNHQAANMLMSSFSGHTFRPQRPGEQAELPSTTDWDAAPDDVFSAVELKPDPLLIRTQHGHAVVMELDGEAEVARAVLAAKGWRDSSSMAKG